MVIEDIEDLESIEKELGRTKELEPKRKRRRFLPDKAITSRQKKPTDYADGLMQISSRVARTRRSETYQAAVEIHGGRLNTPSSSSRAAEIGLIDTVASRCSTDTLVEVLTRSKSVTKHVIPEIYKPKLKGYECSEDNMVRSIALYYGGGIMGKKKYRQVYRDFSYKKTAKSVRKYGERIKVANCPIPLIVPYNKLMPFIKNIRIGTIYSVSEKLCDGLPEEEKVQGCYRNLKELLLILAQFYFCNSKVFPLVWFDEPNKFYVSLGGDGAPFGKYDTACSWLVGFLNLGKGILSSNENYLLFGANCGENCVPVQRFIKQLMLEVDEIEKTTFPVSVNGTIVPVKFYFAELPNDMKMLAFLAGELSNSAKFFSSFATVSTDNCNKVDGTFGADTNNTWKPWNYSHRVEVAKSVSSFKKKFKLRRSKKQRNVTK